MPDSSAAILQRFRQRRLLLRFSQAELAREVGLNRSALANYEIGRLVLPFNIGLALCRRLRLNPAFAVLGEAPESPFVELSELGLAEGDVLGKAANISFPEGFEKYLRSPLADFLAHHSLDGIVLRVLRGGPEAAARDASMPELERMLAEQSSKVADCKPWQKSAQLEIVQALMNELSRRLAMTGGKRVARGRGSRAESAAEKKSLQQISPSGTITPMQIVKKLKAIRRRAGLTQAAAAKKWGVPLGTLKKYEYCERMPRGLALRQLETILRNADQSGG